MREPVFPFYFIFFYQGSRSLGCEKKKKKKKDKTGQFVWHGSRFFFTAVE